MTQQRQSLWLSKLMLCYLLLLILALLGLTLLEIYYVSHGSAQLLGPLSALPSLARTLQMSHILFTQGLIFNGLLTLVLLERQPRRVTRSHVPQAIGCLALFWNSSLAWQLSGLHIITDTSIIINLARHLHTYPSNEAINQLFNGTSTIILWLSLLIPLHRPRSRHQRRLQHNSHYFITLTHWLYGAYLTLQTLSLTNLSPSLIQNISFGHLFYHEHNTLVWATDFMLFISLLLLILASLYRLSELKARTHQHKSQAVIHWLAFVIGLSLVYAISSAGSKNIRIQDTQPAIFYTQIQIGLVLLLIAHLYYSYLEVQKIRQHLQLNQICSLYLSGALALLYLAIVGFGFESMAQSIADTASVWLTFSHSLKSAAFILLALFFINEFSMHLGTWPIAKQPTLQANRFNTRLYSFISIGFIIALASTGISSYLQHVIQTTAVQKGLQIDYNAVAHSLKPLLLGLTCGLIIIIVGCALCFIRNLLLFIQPIFPNNSIHNQPIHNQPIHNQPIHNQPIHNENRARPSSHTNAPYKTKRKVAEHA